VADLTVSGSAARTGCGATGRPFASSTLAVARLNAVAAAAAPKETVEGYVKRGAEWLDAARKAGAFADPAARQRLAEDKDFEPLRGTDAYQRAAGE
jgi:hypothetical protein